MADAPHPKIVSHDDWLTARKLFLQKEREFTHARDALNAERRRLPMERVEKDYEFDTPGGERTLGDLFEGRPQLIVYHFMFDADGPPPGKQGAPWEEGCPGCSHMVDNMPHPAHLHARGTTLVLVSRAPLEKIAPFKKRMRWTLPWYSSFGSDFNYDFHVSLDESRGSTEYNYHKAPPAMSKGELPGLSVFLRTDEGIFHTYSTYARGLDMLINTHHLLDLTPYGRQEEWEDSPAGWPQSATHGWLKHHDRYEDGPAHTCCGGK